jgi:hypothetical protein
MKKPIKKAKLLLVCTALICGICAVCFACVLNQRLAQESYVRFRDVGYLRGRINQLEAELESLREADTRHCIDCIVTEGSSDTVQNEDATETESETEDGSIFNYTVKEYEGKIGIFVLVNGEEHPVRVLNISVATLTDEDQAALATGIYAESYAELCDIIGRFE